MARQRNGGRGRQDNGGDSGNSGGGRREPAESFEAYTGGSRVEVSVWENERDGRTNYGVSITRSYKKDEKRESIKSLRQQDLPHVCFLLQQAYQWISENQG